jgi:hypothetical protein
MPVPVPAHLPGAALEVQEAVHWIAVAVQFFVYLEEASTNRFP